MAQDKIDVNLLAKAGWTDATDNDYIDEFGLDPNGDINQQMFDLTEKQNYQGYLDRGLKEGQARSLAKGRKDLAMKMAKQAL